jgi:hypothetical protein
MQAQELYVHEKQKKDHGKAGAEEILCVMPGAYPAS